MAAAEADDSAEIGLIAALHQRRLRQRALRLWFDGEAQCEPAGCPSERGPEAWWSEIAAELATESNTSVRPWAAVRALWEQHRAAQAPARPAFAARSSDPVRYKPSFVVPPDSGSTRSPHRRWSVRQCRDWLDWCGVPHGDVLEREELLRRVNAHLGSADCSSQATKDYRGPNYRPPQPEPIPVRPNARDCHQRKGTRYDTHGGSARSSSGSGSDSSARANSCQYTTWDYGGFSYTGYAFHAGEDTGHDCRAGGYQMPRGGCANSPRPQAPPQARPSARSRGPRRTTRPDGGSNGGSKRRASAGGGGGAKEPRDQAWARRVLGVRGTDDAASIRKRYHMLARKYHPDKVAAAGGGGGGGASSDNDAHTATAKFQKIAAAYELISAL